jgi:hypothetical protein
MVLPVPGMMRRIHPLVSVGAFFFLVLVLPFPAQSETNEAMPGKETPALPEEQFKRIKLVFEPDAYYTDLELIVALTKDPIPQMGEKTESDIYRTLLSRAAVLPRYLVFEGSVNPMPYLGVYLKRNDPGLYGNAQLSGSFNWIQALTAGFEEPYAVSLLAGNVVGFDIAGSRDIKGNGYSGYLFSAGNYHIRNNTLIHDRWQEIEWKMKGDRKSPVKKLSWSFRIGAKLHGNPNITDILYLSLRRSRLDYKPEGSSILNNSGVEYTLDLDRKTSTPIRHYLYVDKKWPLQNRQIALAIAAGFVWESARKYTGALATGEGTSFQFLLRPNIEF